MGKTMRALTGAALVASALALGGCAIPPAISIASLAFDGASYLTTGKTITEHGLSAATEEDCKFLRIVEDGKVCRAVPKYDTTAADETLTGHGYAAAPGENTTN